MPNAAVLDMTGAKVGTIKLKDSVFGIEPNAVVMHMAVVNYLANQRQGTQSTLTRTEVSGGGKKPWRQKGTGRARQGSLRAPNHVGGGIALGPKPRDYYFTVNKKERQLALKSALSDKVLTESVEPKQHFTQPPARYTEASLVKTLGGVGINDLILKNRQGILVNTKIVDCDYYRFLEGDARAINSFTGQYMSAYSWAEFTVGYLENQLQKTK